MNVQWWCAATGAAWEWSWRPYPGVWLFMALLIATALHVRHHASPAERRRGGMLVAGVLCVWAALDWPVGALGAGYLASAHMLQFLLLALIAPPLLLLALPPSGVRGLPVPRLLAAGLRLVAHPIFAMVLFQAVVAATHLPVATDTLMRSQLGSFAIDAAWLGAGLLMWWPIVGPVHATRPLAEPVAIVYLLAGLILMTAPGALITFADLPMYGLYELAPRMSRLGALEDQRLAGLMMKVGGGAVIWIAVSILFFRWQRDEDRLLRRDTPASVVPQPR